MTGYSLFADTSSFSYTNLLKTKADYERIRNVRLYSVNSSGIEAFENNYYSIYAVVVFALLVVSKFNQEREGAMWLLAHGAANGRVRLALKRAGIMAVVTLAFYAANFWLIYLISNIYYNSWKSIASPIQSSEYFKDFTHAYSQLGYVFHFFLFSSAVVVCMSVVIWMLFTAFKNSKTAIVFLVALTALEYILYSKIAVQSNFALLRRINIFSLFKINEIYRNYYNWGFGKTAVQISDVVLAGSIFVAIIGALLATVVYSRMYPSTGGGLVKKVIAYLNEQYQKLFCKFNIAFMEIHKYLFTHKGIVVLIFAVAGTIYFSWFGVVSFSDLQKKNDEVYLEKGGKYYEEVVEQIASYKAEYAQAMADFAEAGEQYNSGLITSQELAAKSDSMQYYATQLSSMQEIMTKLEYIDKVSEEKNIQCWLMSDRGYKQVFGTDGRLRNIFIMVIIMLAVFFISYETYDGERKSHMYVLIRASRQGQEKVFRRRIIADVLMCILLSAFLYLLNFGILNIIYDLPYSGAPLASLSFTYESIPSKLLGISIRAYVAIRGLCVVAASVLASILGIALSYINANKVRS
jgi:hypothetical protein